MSQTSEIFYSFYVILSYDKKKVERMGTNIVCACLSQQTDLTATAPAQYSDQLTVKLECGVIIYVNSNCDFVFIADKRVLKCLLNRSLLSG